MLAPTMRLAVFAVAVGLLCGAASAQQVVQLPLTLTNDVVREPGGTINGGGIDPATNLGPAAAGS